MSIVPFFLMLDDEESVFRFQIDTRNILPGATNGAQLDNRFVLPIDVTFASTYPTNFILKVSDGRPDISVSNSNLSTARILTFATPNIYEITLIGTAQLRFNNQSPDARKMTWVYEIGLGFKFSSYAFEDTINMTWNAPFVRFNELNRIFVNTKAFGPLANLSSYIVDDATLASYTFANVATPLTSVISGFFLNLVNGTDFYRSAPLALVSEVQIIAPKLTTISGGFYLSNMRGRIVIRSEVLTNMDNLCRGYTNPPSLGEVDVRRITNAALFITSVMSTANVDATLLGWVNNFDWTGIPSVTNKVTFDFYNSRYSNNSAVISAKAFLESKGILFTRLTIL
ncbi:hypothetical protein PQ459_10065 [Chryseobacterium sp. KACC 21268]|nr:hypothetical protein PQ459_10065 [Chryseobacterium sp. KACC 21268]